MSLPCPEPQIQGPGQYLLVRNGIRRRYPKHPVSTQPRRGFVPYASHRMAVSIMGVTGRSLADSLDDFSSFYFDTALSSSAAALPTLLAFARPGHVTFGSDWPFAPLAAARLSPPAWTPIPTWTQTHAAPSTEPTLSRCSPDSAQRRRRR